MDINDHIARIYNKFQLKLKHISNLEKDNLRQQQELVKLRTEHESLLERIRLLEEQNQILKAATGKMDEPDKIALEQSINKYIRDIDKCIKLLSD